jgi:predicted nucleic acid-binding protein
VTTDAKRVFVDTNILASALLPESPRYFHARGILRRLAEADAEVWISRQVIREYLATMTRYEQKWSNVTRAALIDAVRTIERHYFVAEELPIVAEQLYFLLGQVPTGGKQVHDANIVATMIAYDVRTLLTYNLDDFKRFGGFIEIADSL